MERDYCYVGDVVKANILALEKGSGDYFNIGTGRGTRTLALYNIIFEAFKELTPGVPEEFADPVKQIARPGDLKKSCLVIKKGASRLGVGAGDRSQKGGS